MSVLMPIVLQVELHNMQKDSSIILTDVAVQITGLVTICVSFS